MKTLKTFHYIFFTLVYIYNLYLNLNDHMKTEGDGKGAVKLNLLLFYIVHHPTNSRIKEH